VKAGKTRTATRRADELGRNAAEGLQTPSAVADEARDLRSALGEQNKKDDDEGSPDAAAAKAEFQAAEFDLESVEKLFSAPIESVPSVASELQQRAATALKNAFQFSVPDLSPNFASSVSPNIVNLPPKLFVPTTATIENAQSSVLRAQDLVFSPLPPKEKEEEDPPDIKETETTSDTERANEDETELNRFPSKTKIARTPVDDISDTIENATNRVDLKTRDVRRRIRTVVKSAVKLSGATRADRDLSALDKNLRQRLRAEKLTAPESAAPSKVKTAASPPTMNIQRPAVEEVARVAKKISKKISAAKRTIEQETDILIEANKASGEAVESLETEYDRASNEISRKLRHVAKDAQADSQRVENAIREIRSIPVPPSFVRTTAPAPEPVPPSFVRTTVTPPQTNVQPAAQEEVNRVAAGRPPPVPPSFVRTTVTPPQTNVQPAAQEEVNRVAAGRPPPVPPSFVRTTAPAPEPAEEMEEIIELQPLPQDKRSEQREAQKLTLEQRSEMAGLTEEEFDRDIKQATAYAIELEANRFNQHLFDVRELARRYAPELAPHFKPWSGNDVKQKEHLIELAVEVNRRIQKLGQKVSRPLNKEFIQRIKAKAEKRREKVKLKPKFGGKIAELIENRPYAKWRRQREENEI
jgi:hypothetical protein